MRCSSQQAEGAPYSTVHPSITPSRKVLSKRQEDEADNEEEMFEFVVEPFKKGKENTIAIDPVICCSRLSRS